MVDVAQMAGEIQKQALRLDDLAGALSRVVQDLEDSTKYVGEMDNCSVAVTFYARFPGYLATLNVFLREADRIRLALWALSDGDIKQGL